MNEQNTKEIGDTHKSINLMQGDCLKLMGELPDESIDLVLTDPPYNISQKNNFSTMKSANRQGINFGDWDTNFDQISYLRCLAPKIRKGGHIIIFNAIENFSVIIDTLENNNFVFKDVIVWTKNNPMPRNRDRRLVCSTELAVLLTKKGAKWTFNRTNPKYNRNVFEAPVVSGKQRKHPTQKPVSLLKDLIEIFTTKGDTVLDPFMGSGSTGIACIETGRNFIGIEKDNTYFEVAYNWINSTLKDN